jgi:hypothetical protein
MMLLDLAVGDKIKQLRREGLRPSEHLVRSITKAGTAAVAPLLALATDVGLLHQEPPDCYAPLHAMRILGELGSPEIVAPLLRELPVELDYEDEQLPRLWAEEAPQIIGHLGAIAVEPLWAIADDESWNMAGRGAALIALSYATAVDTSLREAIVAGLRGRLERTEDTIFASHMVVALANLGAREVYSDVMARYRDGRLAQEIIPAGAARQLLLTDGLKRLACAAHPLWERYDQHGPYPEEREV